MTVLPSADPRSIFVNADRFRKAAGVLIRQSGDVELGQPIIVLFAFASELFLTCIIAIETGHAPRGHDLAKLYSQVGDKSKARIKELRDNDMAPKRSQYLDVMENEIGVTIP